MRSLTPEQAMHRTRIFCYDILFLTIVIGGLFFLFLGNRPLFVPDEGRYAEIAREMFMSGNYITPTLNDIIYFEKPALFYWLGALAFKIGGVGLWPIRSINALFALIGTLITYTSVRTLYNRVTGLLAALILATSLLYFVMAHMVSLDMPVTVFLTATLYAFMLGIHTDHLRQRRHYLYAAAIAAALAVLTKGLIGIVFPALIIGIYTVTTGKIQQMKTWHLPTCLLLFALVAAPWHLLVQYQHPAFFHFYFIEQHILRYTDLSIGHYEPFWFFIPYLLAGCAPWVLFLPQTFKLAISATWHKQNHTTWFFLLWFSVIFIFFSCSKSKLIPYILPLFPALAILIANYIAQRFYHTDNKQPSSPLRLLAQNKAISTLITLAWFALVSLIAYAPHLDTRTIAPLALQLKPLLHNDDIVVTYNQYYQDLPFYLQRRVSILNWRNELSFGMQLQNTNDWMLDDMHFWQLWFSKQQVYVMISQPEWVTLLQKFPKVHFYLLGATDTTLLISNRAPR